MTVTNFLIAAIITSVKVVPITVLPKVASYNRRLAIIDNVAWSHISILLRYPSVSSDFDPSPLSLCSVISDPLLISFPRSWSEGL